MWHCSAPSPLPQATGSRGAALLAGGTGSCRGTPRPARHCRIGEGLLFCSFFALIKDGCGTGSLETRAKQNLSPGLCPQRSHSHQH